MDVRAYYRKIREAEATIAGEHVVTVSLATPEGGKAGVRTEVPREVAAKLIAEDRARLATDEESREFRSEIRAAKARHDEEETARKMQVMVVPTRPSRRKERS